MDTISFAAAYFPFSNIFKYNPGWTAAYFSAYWTSKETSFNKSTASPIRRSASCPVLSPRYAIHNGRNSSNAGNSPSPCCIIASNVIASSLAFTIIPYNTSGRLAGGTAWYAQYTESRIICSKSQFKSSWCTISPSENSSPPYSLLHRISIASIWFPTSKPSLYLSMSTQMCTKSQASWSILEIPLLSS